jgi:hypothetical protein
MEYRRGLIESLFDTSFSDFITVRFIRFLYVVSLVLAGLAVIAFVFGALANSWLGGIFCAIIAPVLFLLYAIGIRIWLELILVIFRIEENTRPVEAGSDLS